MRRFQVCVERGLLRRVFRDGWREKSHCYIARYLKEFYMKTGSLMGDVLNSWTGCAGWA